ncbi:MAG: type II toxin-antitoxin system VapC family toxin [Gammaproteobacteria bacterium]|nr:type II toxin-antitoxin system VapC family toxin [Gammaproteobacteria bacterium]
MLTYVDTSVLVALCTNEMESVRVDKWYSNCKDELISAVWCITEFASALSIKQTTGQINQELAHQSWEQFKILCNADINLLSLDPSEYYAAANMILEKNKGLRAGDALHLACAQKQAANNIATLDKVMAKHAKMLKIKNIFNIS